MKVDKGDEIAVAKFVKEVNNMKKLVRIILFIYLLPRDLTPMLYSSWEYVLIPNFHFAWSLVTLATTVHLISAEYVPGGSLVSLLHNTSFPLMFDEQV